MKYGKLLVIGCVFIIAVVIHSLYFGREYFTASPPTKTPLTKENVQAIMDEIVLDYLSVYQSYKDSQSKDPRVVYRLKAMGNELNQLNDQYPMIQYTIRSMDFSKYPAISLEDLQFVKQYLTYRIGSSLGTSGFKPAELLDLDQFSARTRSFVTFVSDRANVAQIQLPADFQSQAQSILTNMAQLKKNLPNMKPDTIPIFKSDMYLFMTSFAKNNFIEEPTLKQSEIPVLNTENLPIKKSSIQLLTNAVTNTISPPVTTSVPSVTPPAPVAPIASVGTPAGVGAAPQGYKFSELVGMLLSYAPTQQTNPTSVPVPAPAPLQTTQAAPTGVTNGLLDKIRKVVREEVQTIKMGPKDAVNTELVKRYVDDQPKQTANSEQTASVQSNGLVQGQWFRTAADSKCPYAQGQQRTDGAEPIPSPVPPFNMDDYIRKDSIPCWACTLK